MLAAVVSPAGAAGPPAAERPADVPDGMEWDPATGTLRSDLLAIDAERGAKATGQSEAALLAHLRAQSRKDDLVRELEARFPDRCAGAYWAEDGGLVLQFKSGAPDAAGELIKASGTAARTETAKYSEREAEALSASITSDLESAGAWAVVAMDGRQRFTVTLEDGRSLGSAAASKESIADRLAQKFNGVEIDVSASSAPLSAEWAAQGGTLASRADLTHYCTNGFTVYVGTTRGLVTAGHCENATMNTYTDPLTGGQTSLSYRGEHQSSFGDMQWAVTGASEVDDFYTSSSFGTRDVSGTYGTIAKLDQFNYWGLGTQKLYLDAIAYPLVNLTGGPGNLACVAGGQGGPGDSGGPVFVGGSAVGIVRGSITIDGVARACFSKASRFDDGLGVWVATS